nr:hypothetical protein [Acidimicrobiales bacterium]
LPKVGSTSVQGWIHDNASLLRKKHGYEIIVGLQDPKRPGGLVVGPFKRGVVHSGWAVRRYRDSGYEAPVLHEFFEALDVQANRHPKTIVAAEHFGNLLRVPNVHLTDSLEWLGQRHDVTVACYVRPQHLAIESAWKQWGFWRPNTTPSRYVAYRSNGDNYYGMMFNVTRKAPSVQFVIRPFLSELLLGGNVVFDFARLFLFIEDPPGDTGAFWLNAGIPLEVANLLHYAPEDLFHPNTAPGRKRLEHLKDRLAGFKLEESPAIRRSRLIIQHYCYEKLEPDNKRLIDFAQWPIEHFVAPIDTDEDPATLHLEELDELWASTASSGEHDFIFHVLRDYLPST